MIIKSITVRNFKCFVEECMHFEKATVLTGHSGSGKTALSDILWHIKEWFEYPDDVVMDFIGQSHGWDKVVRDKDKPIEVDILVITSDRKERYFYWRCYRDHVDYLFKGDNSLEMKDFEELKMLFSNMKFHYDHDYKGLMAAAKLHNEPLFNAVLEKIQSILPQIEDISFDTKAYSNIDDEVKYYGDVYFHEKGIEEPFGWLSISPAMQKIFEMAVMTEVANGVVICDEDPAESLYYKITDIVSLWFQYAAQKKNVQFIMTSYSPFFVNAFDPRDVWLFEREPRKREYSTITNIPNHPFFNLSTNPDDYSTWEEYEANMKNWYFDFISIT